MKPAKDSGKSGRGPGEPAIPAVGMYPPKPGDPVIPAGGVYPPRPGGQASYMPRSGVMFDANMMAKSGRFMSPQAPGGVAPPLFATQYGHGVSSGLTLSQALSNMQQLSSSMSDEDLLTNNGVPINPMLMNLNIPTNNFSNAINFETFPSVSQQDMQRMNGLEADSYDDDDDAASSQLDEQEHFNLTDHSIGKSVYFVIIL